MNVQKQSIGKAYYHQQMIKMTYAYLPIFSLIVLVCSAFEKLRFFLYLTVVGATYGYILNQMKKKHVMIEFKENDIMVDKTSYNFKDIESYHLSLPLNELLMLRIRTIDKKYLAVYVDKDLKQTIEMFFNKHFIISHKTNHDNYLQYGHLIFSLLCIFLCGMMYALYNLIYYKILN